MKTVIPFLQPTDDHEPGDSSAFPPLTSRLVSRTPVRIIRIGHRGTRGEVGVKDQTIAYESALERDFLL